MTGQSSSGPEQPTLSTRSVGVGRMGGSGRLGGRDAWWLAVRGGHLDGLRIALTAAASSIAALLVLVGGDIARRPTYLPYLPGLLTDRGLLPGVLLALALTCLPALAVAGFATRVGAARRSARLRTYRLSGASTADVRRVLGIEGALAGLLGVVGGLVLYAVLVGVIAEFGSPAPLRRDLVGGSSEIVGWHLAPAVGLRVADLLPHAWAIAVAAVVVPVAVLAAAHLAARSVDALTHGDPPSRRPVRLAGRALLLLLAGGVLAVVLVAWIADGRANAAGLPVGALSVVLVVTGLLDAGEAAASSLADIVAPRTSRATVLLAARHVQATPRAMTRSGRFLVIACLVGGIAAGAGSTTLAARAVDVEFFSQSYALVGVLIAIAVGVGALALLVGVVEVIVTRRRLASATRAVGAPPGAVGRAVVLAAIAPVAPAVVLAWLAGAVAGGSSMSRGMGSPVSVPWGWIVVCGLVTVLLLALLLTPAFVASRRMARVTELRTAA